MQEQTAEIAALRAEIMKLLHQQLEALDSPEGLTDTKLMECYDRQGRVQALREQLQMIANTGGDSSNVIAMPSTAEKSVPRFRALDERELRIS